MTESVKASVLAVSALSSRANRIVLRVPASYRWTSGQHLALLLPSKPAFYSIASADQGDGLLELVVGVSAEAASFVRGGELAISLPAGSAVLPRGRADLKMGLVAMGTGIAPLRATIQEVVAAQGRAITSGPVVTLLHGARTARDRLFAEEFEALAERGVLDYRPVVSRPGPEWGGRVGRVQAYLHELPTQLEHFGVCGSRQMVDQVTEALRERGAASVFAQGY